MNAPTTGITVKIILNETGDPPTKIADAELHFADGPLSGFKLIGFAVWESRPGALRFVTFPARQYRVNGEPRAFALLRPISGEQPAPDATRALILAACHAAEAAMSDTPATTAEQLVRETLQATHNLTREQAIELTEDISIVMGVEQLNARGAWRLIVARLGGIHNLPAHLNVLTKRHRAKHTNARIFP
jgi:hypothetical protein